MIKRIGAMLLLATMIMSMLILPAQAAGSKVTRGEARLRKDTSTATNSNVLAVIPGGTEISVLGTSGGWTKTMYNGHTGYVATDLLMELTRSGYYPLKFDDNNPFVAEMQKRLTELGYYSGRADGEFGQDTLDAVKAFQKANKMTQDGIAGGETQRVMYSDQAKSSTGETSGTSSSGGINTPVSDGSTSETLKVGSRSDSVKRLQQRLGDLGYYSGKADGIFGASTEKAVIDFQKRAGLTTDGKAGSVTQTLLYATGAPTASGSTASTGSTTESTYTTYKQGMTNDGIKKLQQRLKDLGYMTANPTGYFGTQTAEAVRRFQAKHYLTVDGIAGSETQSRIFASDAEKAITVPDDSKTYAVLKEGMKSSAVTTMQKRLKELGYFNTDATGTFGSVTKTAVVAFQKKNGLTADGIAGSATLNRLYGANAIAASAGSSSAASGIGKIQGPSTSQVKLLHWFKEVKPALSSSSVVLVYDPVSGYGFKIKSLSRGNHFDSEPLTAEDTKYLNAAFGGVTTWTPKAVYVQLPSGVWTLATMHNTPHLSGNINDNNFDGHLCIHFLRDMAECKINDPNYGVQHQNAIREAWKKMTGIVITD